MKEIIKLLIAFSGIVHVMSTPLKTYSYQRLKRSNQELNNLTFTFDCSDKAIGFYADQRYNCQIFHMCDEDGRRIPHACANETSFNQEFRICDWEYNFNCSEAHKWYHLNELTYATDPPVDEI